MARILVGLLFLVSFSPAMADGAQHQRDLGKQYKKANFKIGGQSFEAYMAEDDPGRAEGLMNITEPELPQNTGMLFIFENEQPLSFWMKNTLIPLSIAFINAKGVVVDIQEMVPASPVLLKIPTYHSAKPARFALEMHKGWFAKHKIATGAKLSPVPAGQ